MPTCDEGSNPSVPNYVIIEIDLSKKLIVNLDKDFKEIKGRI